MIRNNYSILNKARVGSWGGGIKFIDITMICDPSFRTQPYLIKSYSLVFNFVAK